MHRKRSFRSVDADRRTRATEAQSMDRILQELLSLYSSRYPELKIILIGSPETSPTDRMSGRS